MKMTVLFTTYNRCEELRLSLEAMTRLDCSGLDVKFVVVDNNSTDDTRKIVESFETRLPLLYVYEQRQGKNIALNKALDNVDVGDALVFTDDDVSPESDWLQAIRRSLEEYPDVSVFGGRISVDWGNRTPPYWASIPRIAGTVFAQHELYDEPTFYKSDEAPFGGNYWIRGHIVSDGVRFDERVGPRPKNRIMGSETAFLVGLRRMGYNLLYYPDAAVNHRVQNDLISLNKVYRRMFRQGRGSVFFRGIKDIHALQYSKMLWYGIQICRMLKPLLVLLRSVVTLDQEKRIMRRMFFWVHWGIAYQSILMVRSKNNRI